MGRVYEALLHGCSGTSATRIDEVFSPQTRHFNAGSRASSTSNLHDDNRCAMIAFIRHEQAIGRSVNRQ